MDASLFGPQFRAFKCILKIEEKHKRNTAKETKTESRFAAA